MLFAAIEEAGYDCVVYRNLCEAEAHAQDSILVWRADLLKSPFSNDFQIGDPRLLSQNETSADDLIEWESALSHIHECRWKLRELRRNADARLPAL